MTTRHDPRLINLIAGFLAREFGDDGFLPLSKRDGAAVRLLDLIEQEYQPPLVVDFSRTEWSPEQIAEWTRVFNEGARGPLKVMPPNAADLWRRHTPEQRRAWLLEHRDEAIERGIPGDLVDLMIRDAGRGDAYPEDEITGYPDHVIVNGDHSGCPCGGEEP